MIQYRKHNNTSDITPDAASGSLFWSLNGENLQFTWFDVPAQKQFPAHSHESEQVTYVLQGELFFESEGDVFKVAEGDCILIPSNRIHRVWTKDKPAKAVDAWSPVNEKFLTDKV